MPSLSRWGSGMMMCTYLEVCSKAEKDCVQIVTCPCLLANTNLLPSFFSFFFFFSRAIFFSFFFFLICIFKFKGEDMVTVAFFSQDVVEQLLCLHRAPKSQYFFSNEGHPGYINSQPNRRDSFYNFTVYQHYNFVINIFISILIKETIFFTNILFLI